MANSTATVTDTSNRSEAALEWRQQRAAAIEAQAAKAREHLRRQLVVVQELALQNLKRENQKQHALIARLSKAGNVTPERRKEAQRRFRSWKTRHRNARALIQALATVEFDGKKVIDAAHAAKALVESGIPASEWAAHCDEAGTPNQGNDIHGGLAMGVWYVMDAFRELHPESDRKHGDKGNGKRQRP